MSLSGAAYPDNSGLSDMGWRPFPALHAEPAKEYAGEAYDRRFEEVRRIGLEMLTESLILAQDERWRRA